MGYQFQQEKQTCFKDIPVTLKPTSKHECIDARKIPIIAAHLPFILGEGSQTCLLRTLIFLKRLPPLG